MKKLIAVSSGTLSVTLDPLVDLTTPRPFRALFAVPLDGEQLVTSPEHLGVGYLVSVLRDAGAECRIVEVPAWDDYEEVVGRIVDWGPDVVGLTMTTISSAHAQEFGAVLRARMPDKHIVGGGALVSHRGGTMLEQPGWAFLDSLVRGEGEVPMLRLAEALHAGLDLSTVPNFAYRDGDEIRRTDMTTAIHDLDHLPMPARDQFEEHGARVSPRFSFLRLSTSRGCTSFCTFCNAPHARNRIADNPIWRGCSPTKIVDEMELLYRKFGCRSFSFVDSTFEDPGGTSKAKWRISCIAQEILDRELQVHFGCCMQARNWTDDDHDVIDLLWRAGLDYVFVGIEAGSETDLRTWKKRSNMEDNERIVRLLRENNIFVQFGYITFHPYSTFDTVRENFAFLLRNDVGHDLQKFLARLEVYAGAEIVETLREDGLLLPSFDEQCDEFGYVYRDPRIAHLADALSALYGAEYQQHYTNARGPWKFEAIDDAVHLFFSRMYRSYGRDDAARELLDVGRAESQEIRRRMAQFNHDLVTGYVDRAEAGELHDDDVRRDMPMVVDFVLKCTNELRSVQVRTGLRLGRAGFSPDAIGLAPVA